MNIPIDITGIVLHTRRLVLREWRGQDLDDFYEYASADGVGQMAGWLPHVTRKDTLNVLERFIRQKKTFALEYNDHVIGSLGIEEYDEEEYPELESYRCRELGFVLSRTYWGQGLMPEALQEVIRWLFEDKHLDLLVCRHYASNRQSARVQQKCGFREYRRTMHKNIYETDVESVTNILRYADWKNAKAERSECI
ncbi:MAG: GNAT family N-acetyltransferase [Solobacterium sp.]|nr:GNAT family N-acetyltransferase [Solobacterium sp.]